MKNRSISFKFQVLLLAFFGLLLSVTPVLATEPTEMVVSQDTMVSGDYMGAGRLVDISSPVLGDIYVAGGTINIGDDVGGDVVAAGGNITISGNVYGSVRVVGGSVMILGEVAKNVSIAGGNLAVEKNAIIGGSLYAAGGTVDVRGNVTNDIKAAGGNILLAGQVGGLATVYSFGGRGGGGLVILPQAVLSGGLEHTSPKPADIRPGAMINGLNIYHRSDIEERTAAVKKDFRFAGKVFGAIVWTVLLIAKFILLLIFVLALGKLSAGITDSMLNKFWPSLGWGAVFLFAVPAAAFVLFFTVIGIPFSFLMMALYLPAVFIAPIFASMAFGKFLCGWLNWKKDSFVWTSIFGFFLLNALTTIGFIGFLLCMFSVLWGLGGLSIFKKNFINKLKG